MLMLIVWRLLLFVIFAVAVTVVAVIVAILPALAVTVSTTLDTPKGAGTCQADFHECRTESSNLAFGLFILFFDLRLCLLSRWRRLLKPTTVHLWQPTRDAVPAKRQEQQPEPDQLRLQAASATNPLLPWPAIARRRWAALQSIW